MAQVHVVRGSSRQWITVLALVGAAMTVVLWWWSHREDAAVQQQAAQQATEAPAQHAEANAPVTASMQRVSADANLDAQQAAAAKVVEQSPGLKEINGAIKERPAFVSEMEWNMLKGVAQQSPSPDATLNKLVNKLRFMKQLELWQSMAHSGDTAKRQVLAEQLLDDLPQRVANADLDKPEAQKLQASLLKDAVSDEQVRRKRAEVEARRLVVPAAS